MQTTDGDDSFAMQDVELLWDVKPPDCMLDISGEINENSAPALQAATMTPSRSDESSVPASSPHLFTPQAKEFSLPFSSCNESPISAGFIAASTPFHGQRISSTSSLASEHNKKCSGKDRDANATFDTIKQPPRCFNEAAVMSIHEKEGNCTFVKDVNSSFSNIAKQNLTFDAKPVEKAEPDDMESCVRLESSPEPVKEKSQRKPLSTITQPKVASRSTNATKKLSRLGAPRMNAAAISRIQARSPQAKNRSDASDTNSTMKKPSSTARKSLLPPATKFCHRFNSTFDKSDKTVPQKSDTNASQHETGGTPTKRKAQESPKRAGRSPKMAGVRNAVPSHATALNTNRSNSAPVSRVPNSSTRTSRLQRPSALKGPTSYSRLAGCISSSKKTGSSGSLLTSSKSGSQRNSSAARSKPHETLVSAGNRRPDSLRNKMLQHNASCATALATLLDYVVNKLDGLSAPQLSKEKELLQHLLNNKDQLNSNLSSQVLDLQTKISQVENEYDMLKQALVEEQERKHEQQKEIARLLSDLDTERQKCRQMRMACDVECEEMKTRFESEIETLKTEYSEEYEKLSKESEIKVQMELVERMKPYINARSEVQSLSAVLEMKNETIHNLQAQCTSFSCQRDKVDVLNLKVNQLSQKNEDLATQLKDKIEETRKVSEECDNLQRSFSEERNRSAKLLQHNEELKYRLESFSPVAPFNPVFTTSPVLDDVSPFDSTPRNSNRKRSTNFDSASNDTRPRALTYDIEKPAAENDNSI